MPVIGKNFPQSKEARIRKLKEIKEGTPIGSVIIPGHGSLPVYKIPLEFLTYNPYNTRFLAQAKTRQTRLGRELSNERPDDIEEIEGFLWTYKKDTNKSTIDSLIKDGQLQPGVVTMDGVILAGNRRFRLLNEIDRHPSDYSKNNANIDGLKFFEAAILDTQLDKKEIVRYESFYQYGTDDKVDYDPIQKYIAAFEQKELGFELSEIAKNFMSITNGNTKKVEEWIEVYELMVEYLEYIGEPEIYTNLTGKEESFLNLNNTLKSLGRGKAKAEGWDYTETDEVDLKLRYFDYIRIGKSTHDFRIFKKIFLNKERWDQFNRSVTDIVNDADSKIKTIDEYRSEYVEETEEHISEIRNNDYKEETEKKLNKVYGTENAIIVSREEEETPLKIAQQVYQKLEKLDNNLSEELVDKIQESDLEALCKRLKDIQKLVGQIKQRID